MDVFLSLLKNCVPNYGKQCYIHLERSGEGAELRQNVAHHVEAGDELPVLHHPDQANSLGLVPLSSFPVEAGDDAGQDLLQGGAGSIV